MFFGGHDHALTGLPAAFFRPAVREGKPPVVASEKHGYERRVPVHDGLLARTVPRADHAHTVVFRVDRVMLRVNLNGISRDWLWFRSCRHFRLREFMDSGSREWRKHTVLRKNSTRASICRARITTLNLLYVVIRQEPS